MEKREDPWFEVRKDFSVSLLTEGPFVLLKSSVKMLVTERGKSGPRSQSNPLLCPPCISNIQGVLNPEQCQILLIATFRIQK